MGAGAIAVHPDRRGVIDRAKVEQDPPAVGRTIELDGATVPAGFVEPRMIDFAGWRLG